MATQQEKALRLLQLHRGESPLVLVNAWDAASARIVESEGYPAVATGSAGVAFALGFTDGQKLPWPEMLSAIQRIASAVQAPLTADIESGFSSTEEHLREVIASVIAAGAVGINLEDALPHQGEHGPLYPLAEQISRIRAARESAERAGVHLVINARTDAYWQKGVPAAEAMRNTLERGKAYLAAGADCIFIPGLKDRDHIRAIVDELKAPVNILAVAGAPSIEELKKLGVKRISMGSGPMRAAMGLLRRIAREAKSKGTYTSMLEDTIPYADMMAIMSG
ncbi:MAG TPA: isocitrate lyase/phosphoenolpyruvate mutase family protein [Candidatus Angelobacter sp.]|nr:isocitrate lyase/phosphoenolpyruvate mutase family protein [Candidatus Angelobacter sp.]